MIKVNVLSNERAWSSRLRKKELFFNNICRAFPKKYRFLNKKVSLTLLLSNNKNIKKLNKIMNDNEYCHRKNIISKSDVIRTALFSLCKDYELEKYNQRLA